MISDFRYLNTIARSRIIQHLLFWSLSYFILVNLFSSSGNIQKVDYVYTALFHLPLFVVVYVNLLFLIPTFLSRKRYLLYSICIILFILGGSEFNIILFDKLITHFLPGYYFISYYELPDLLIYTSVYVVISSLFKFSKGWFLLTEATRQLTQLQKEKIETELKALKGQINPHFLFNSMNSIYSLALNHSEKTPEIVLKLSDIMRYIIYEANKDFVDLSKEVNYLQDYIVLQKLRTDNRATINFDIDGNMENVHIAPLLLFPLVENSFKHGVKGATGKSFVSIQLFNRDGVTRFIVENNKGLTDNVEKKEYKGIGLDNIRKRLHMVYPDKHQFNIIETETTYKVELIINHL